MALLPQYDKEKYKEMILDAAETVLGYFGFDRTAYSNNKAVRRKKWYEELREQKVRCDHQCSGAQLPCAL